MNIRFELMTNLRSAPFKEFPIKLLEKLFIRRNSAISDFLSYNVDDFWLGEICGHQQKLAQISPLMRSSKVRVN